MLLDPELAGLVNVMRGLRAEPVHDGDLLGHAVALAVAGWAVLPCLERDEGRAGAKAPVGRLVPHGVLDASSDPAVVAAWWTARPSSLIGVRVPEPLLVLDVDPRHGGDRHLAVLVAAHGPLPATLGVLSGRGDGGRHHYYSHPGGNPTGAGLRAELQRLGVLPAERTEVGLDLKTSTGYVIVPPSPHPSTGRPYRWEHRPVVALPSWLRTLLLPAPAPRRPSAAPRLEAFPRAGRSGGSIADDYTAASTWTGLLGPLGWTLGGGDGESDGSGWRHPTASTAVSATVRHGCLFVYSPNAGLPVTEPNAPSGLTRFRAYAWLHHGGDLSAAARHLREAAQGQVAA